ncbi:MAG: 50S ribosomal protein L3 [Conexivisphaerales archaeon]
MGHRKHSAPRRGSLAFLPRARAQSLVPRVRFWGEGQLPKPSLAGFFAFKVGMLHLITVDDREKTPNFGKPLFNPATVLSVPKMRVCGLRVYSFYDGYKQVAKDVYDYDFELFSKMKNKLPLQQQLESLAKMNNIAGITAIVAVKPADVGLDQKTHILYEIPVLGGSNEEKISYAKQLLGKSISFDSEVAPGKVVDIAGITKGKGFEGPITRMGVKRKQHKSRKSVRAVGVLSPWHPHDVMYTVPRGGQMGFHQRIEYNHKILMLGDESSSPITPKGGFPHYGILRGNYMIVKGSVPGPAKRPLLVRLPVRPHIRQVKVPQVMFVSSKVS